MSDASSVPTLSQLFYFQWATPSAPNPRLSSPIDDDDTTITFTSAPKDEGGAVITAPFLMGVKNSDSYVETIYCPNGADGASGLSATGCIRGIDLSGLDYTVNNDSFAASHDQDSPVFCNVTGVIQAVIISGLQGDIASGGAGFIIGTDAAANTVTISRSTAAGTNLPWLRWNSSGSEVEFSDNGTDWTAINDVTTSNLVDVSATDTTPGYLSAKLVSATGGIDFSTLGGGGNETLNLAVDLSEAGITAGPLASVISDVTATEAEIDQALDGISANVTDTNLNTLTAGSSSDASSLHSHSSTGVSFTAGGAITADDAVALLPVEVEWYDQLTEADLNLGDVNANQRQAIRIVPSVTTSTLTTMVFRGREINAATELITISIQGDSSGEPDGTPIANGTANTLDPSGWTGTYASRTATWASPPTLTAGTTYWIVFSQTVEPGDGIQIGVNSTYDENYLTFERQTYDLDAASWGSSATNATPFFWFDAQQKLLGMKVVPADNDWGGRTWPFIGFAQSTVAEDASVDVTVDIYDSLSGLVAGADYYIGGTAGNITATDPQTAINDGSTAPTEFAYKIGRAINTTTIKIELGEKRVICEEVGTTLTATTTRQYISWFRPKHIRVNAVRTGASSGGQGEVGISSGLVTTQAADYGISGFASPDAVAGQNPSTSLSISDSATNYMTGAASAFTDAGFTYTYTETGAATMSSMLEVLG